MINKVKIFSNRNTKSQEITEKLKNLLIKNNFIIVEDNYDLGIAIGGDGTFLKMVKESHFNPNILYVGINSGTLGFAQDISVDEIEELIKRIKTNDYIKEEIGIEKIKVITKEKEYNFNALNEIVIRDNRLKAISLEVIIDNISLEEYIGDGLLISTSFGSTAYNLSVGGSIIYNELNVLTLTPISPMNNKKTHNLLNPIILSDKKEIIIKPNKKDQSIITTIDGDNYLFDNAIEIRISLNGNIKRLCRKDYNYTEKIKDKLIK